MSAHTIFSTIFVLVLLSASTSSMACSPAQEEPFQIQPPPESGEVIPNAAPVARLAEVHRGRRAGRGESSCTELAYLVFAIRDDSPSLPFVYAFEQVSGEGPDTIFFPGLYVGGSNGEGERLFSFFWPDITPKPEPFKLQVKVTPYSRSGTPGPSVVVAIESEI